MIKASCSWLLADIWGQAGKCWRDWNKVAALRWKANAHRRAKSDNGRIRHTCLRQRRCRPIMPQTDVNSTQALAQTGSKKLVQIGRDMLQTAVTAHIFPARLTV